MKVHILATCRKPELLPATLMVFKSLRLGFPTADVLVWVNGYSTFGVDEIMEEGAKVTNCFVHQSTIHHQWIETLLNTEKEPFYICDTDICFWKSVEGWDHGDSALVGRYSPEFFCRFVNAITRPRLHTSLLYMNPKRIREETDKYFSQFPKTPFNPRPNLIYPKFHPERTGDTVKTYFHDTCSLLYQAIGGKAYSDEQNDCFDHLHFGTLSDIVGPCYLGERIEEAHRAVLSNPNYLRGAWRTDAQFYKKHGA